MVCDYVGPIAAKDEESEEMFVGAHAAAQEREVESDEMLEN